MNVRALTNEQLLVAKRFVNDEINKLYGDLATPAPPAPLTKDDVLKMATADAAKDSDTHIYLDRDGSPLAALTTVSDLDRVYKMLGKVPGPDPDQARHYARSLENAKASKTPCKVDDCRIDHNDLTEDAFIEHTGLNPYDPRNNYHPNFNPDGSVKARFDLMFAKSATITKRSSMSFDWQTNPTEGPGRECEGCQAAADNSPYDDPYSVPDPNEICLGMLRGNGDCTCQIYIGDNDEPVDAVDFDPTDYDPTLKAASADLTFDQKLAKQAASYAEHRAQERVDAFYGSDSSSSSDSSDHDHLSSSDERARLAREFRGVGKAVDVDAITKRIEAKAVEAIDTVKARLAKSKKEKSITTRDIRRVVEEVVQEQLKAHSPDNLKIVYDSQGRMIGFENKETGKVEVIPQKKEIHVDLSGLDDVEPPSVFEPKPDQQIIRD